MLFHKDHRREWEDFLYVYPVISRRSGGVSIGVNLNPDKICNFHCTYCEVDRHSKPKIYDVDLEVLERELRAMLGIVQSGKLFKKKPFADTPKQWRRLNDIAFSGDGEPTTCPVFAEAAERVSRLRNELAPEAKLILITNASCLDRPSVKEGIGLMQQTGAYEIWAKLDAGTERYYGQVNRSSVPLERIVRNITEISKQFPVKIQSLFLRLHGKPPSNEEVEAYCARLNQICKAGGQILAVQIYTVARPTPETWATALSQEELEDIAGFISARTGLAQEIIR